jgi:hypothetical protein
MTTREPRRQRGSQPDRPSGERSLDALLDALLEGGPLPDGEPARWQPVAQVLTALTSAPEGRELTGEARALAEFRARARQPERPAPPPRRAPRWVTSLRAARPAVVAATGAVLVGGFLAVAYAGDLPAPAQRLAHDTINAPAAHQPALTGPGPASSQPASPLGTGTGQASSPPAHAPRPGRQTPGGSPYGHWRQPGASSSAPGMAGASPSGRPGHDHSGQGGPGQSGGPSGSPSPGSTQQPAPSPSTGPPASTAPSAGATPSPSATPSATGQSGQQHQPGRAGTQSTPP